MSEKMNDGYRVEYSESGDQVCIIPDLTMPVEHFSAIVIAYRDLGYVDWLPADDRKGYIFAKKIYE